MTSPKTQYPNADGHYPNGEPAPPASSREGQDPAFEAELYRLAPSRVTVLLVGGTRDLKQEVARALHERSPRAQEPFVVVDCEGLDSDSLEHGLFGGPGYTAGVGGAIQRADAGTLYVATIDQLPLLVQPRFLRFLDQERWVRVVASTDASLRQAVEHGRFRGDLAERLCLVELVLPEAAAVYPRRA